MYYFERHPLFPFGFVPEDFLMALNCSLKRIEAQIKHKAQQEAFIKWTSKEGSWKCELTLTAQTGGWGMRFSGTQHIKKLVKFHCQK